MTTATISAKPHRKLIDIPQDAFEVLSIRAAVMGKSLKKYIEELIVQEAAELDDAETYRNLVATRPDGKVMLTPQEQADFMKRHKLGEYR